MWVARRLTRQVLQRPTEPAALGPAHCLPRSFSSIDSVRQLLNEHRRVPARAGGLGADYGPNTNSSTPVAQRIPIFIQEKDDAVNTLVKELLRIFTRRIPGSLVPDSLVRGFIHVRKEI